MAAMNTSSTYRIMNLDTGTDFFLGANSSNLLTMDSSTAADNRDFIYIYIYIYIWFLTTTDMSPFYRLHTVSDGFSLSLDTKLIAADDIYQGGHLFMANTSNSRGQYWRFDKGLNGGLNAPRTWYLLSNNLTSLYLPLYLDQDTPPFGVLLSAYLSTSSYWNMVEQGWNGPSPAPTSTSASISTTNSTGTTSNASSTPAQASGHSDALSSGQIAGIVLGVIFTLAIIAAVALARVASSRRRKAAAAAAIATPAGYNLPPDSKWFEVGGQQVMPAELPSSSRMELPG
ncbi:hypothetical protein QBC46DRAFT_435214 [Diplogelasinospora grovesii]|uniref:Uncharacterized protein n=1 Tax=Diplogelasinospora grovesii TaxID=303347 RepID=A0AAN6N6U2_9PEZI|nr:hypothetical protein QBC46DRAFT_435214 [Diplogelasinospora grovesii]